MFFMSAFGLLMNLSSCDEDSEPLKSVDLRYNPQDSYYLPASGADPVVFQVKSSDPWEVYGTKDWITVTPAQGGPGEIYDVSVACSDNTGLDDRTDTITVKSDYWIGKQFAIIQKGIAYLNLSNNNDTILTKDIDTKSFTVNSNQDWSTEIDSEIDWLSIVSGSSGTLNGDVTVQTVVNKGEQRSGKVFVYDRHHVKMDSITFVQDGVLLRPETLLIKSLYDVKTVNLSVESNADWTVVKGNEDIEWYSITTNSFTGNGNIEIVLDDNAGTGVRSTELILSTVPFPGTEPVVRTVVLKQGNNPLPVRYEFADSDLGTRWQTNQGTPVFNGDATFASARVTQGNMGPGLYSFRLKQMSADAYSTIYFTYGSMEIRWHVSASSGVTDFSTSPWTPQESKNVAIDISQPHTLSLNLTDNNGDMQVEWILDGTVLSTYVANSGFVVPYGAESFTYLGGSAGSCVYDWYEYTVPIDWGE